MAEAIPGEVSRHDDGLLPGMFDLEINYPDGRRGAVEVTAAADAPAIELWNLVNGVDERWIDPHLVGGWFAVLTPSARAKRIKSELPRLLRELEAMGVREVRSSHRRVGPFEDSVADLGIEQLIQGGTDFPGSIYLTVEQDAERTGGWVPTSGDPLAEWLSQWLSHSNQEQNLSNLRMSHADEFHLFVLLPGFADAPFPVVDLLARDGAPVPAVDPVAPSPLTDIWCMSTWTSGAGMHWSTGNGWQLFEKIVDGVR